jgi:K+-transporting ATPase c subunit
MRAAHIINDRIVNIILVQDLSFPVKDGFLVEDTGSEALGGWAQIGGAYKNNRFYPNRPSNQEQKENRQRTYILESDPIFFMSQRGEATKEEWEEKVASIKNAYPYYFDDEGNLLEVM